jgi:hypothetical protein
VKLADAVVPDAIHSWLNTDQPDKRFATLVQNGTWVDPTLFLLLGSSGYPGSFRPCRSALS